MKPHQYDNNGDTKKEQTNQTKNWKWYFHICFVYGVVTSPPPPSTPTPTPPTPHPTTDPIKAYTHARTHFREKGGYFFNDEIKARIRELKNGIVFQTQVCQILKRGNNFACICLFPSIFKTPNQSACLSCYAQICTLNIRRNEKCNVHRKCLEFDIIILDFTNRVLCRIWRKKLRFA